MATGINNPNQIADSATFYIRDSDGARQLFQIESWSDSDEGSVSNVAGPAGMIGSVRAAGGFTLSLTSRVTKGANEEADWESLRDDDEIFRFEVQVIGGKRKIYPQCRVSNVNQSVGSDGNITIEVTLVSPVREIVRP